ncbi:MAG: hypothetical protein R2710_18095 [Acidimicrobiales bacterium]
MLSGLITIVLVVIVVLAAVVGYLAFLRSATGRWPRRTGVIEQWRLTGSWEDVLTRRLDAATATIDHSVGDALGRPDLRWRLAEASDLIDHQLLACARLPLSSRPAVRREIEALVREYEGVCARLLLDAAQASSAVVRDRLRDIEESVEALRRARNEVAELERGR